MGPAPRIEKKERNAKMSPSLENVFNRAMASLQAGKLDDAERLFKKLLQREPRNFGALNLLGIVLSQGGQWRCRVTHK